MMHDLPYRPSAVAVWRVELGVIETTYDGAKIAR
jgi:hypothetical protein